MVDNLGGQASAEVEGPSCSQRNHTGEVEINGEKESMYRVILFPFSETTRYSSSRELLFHGRH